MRECCVRFMNKHKIVIVKFKQLTLNTNSVVCIEETNHNAKLLATKIENTSQ
jgi:hypothetical protein